MPGRSHRDALRRVFDHCAHIRAKCRAHHCTLHDRFEGKAATALIGGLQVTLDLAGAFDAMPRHRLLEGMEHMNLPLSFIQIVMCWHHQAHYHINHDGTDRVVHATQGVRQGCAVAPLLWLIFSHLISAKLAAKIGYHATVNLLSIFADDYHCSGEFSSTHDLEVILSHIAVLLHTLADMGMTVSPAKSKAILKCAGPGAEQLRRRFTRKTAQGKVLRIYSAQECIDIPLVDSFTYLGAIVSYDHYEDRTLAHRLEVGSNNFGRLTRVLRGRHALTRQHKLRIWQACVYTATVYGLDACGLTPLGAKKLTAQILRQIRLIVRDPVYMTGTSHQQVLTKWNLLSPIEALRHQLHKETVDPEPQPDIFKRGPDSAAWQRVMDTLQDFSPSQLVEMHNQRTHGHPCPECGIYFATRASMLGHMTRKHKDHPARPVNQPTRTFDKHSDALGGLPQCSHCKVKLCDFSSLRKHINEQRCKVLYPTRRPPCSDTPEVTPEVIPPHTIDASAVKVIGPKLSPTPEATHVEPDPSHPASCSGAGPTDDSETQLPYFQRTSVRAMLTKYSENAAFHLQDRQWLRHYCALCSQWIVCTSKVKQHYRLSHPTDHAQYLQSASCLCSKFNTPGSPCEHCSAVTKELQQVFGPLMKDQLDLMEWAPTMKREAEPESAPAERGKVPKTEQGKGRPRQPAPPSKQHWRKGGGKGRGHETPNLTYLIKALARLALQQETALKILRQDYSWVLFIQPGSQGPLPLLFAAAQKWKKSQEEGTTTSTLRTTLFGCLITMLHASLKDIGGVTQTPFQKKAEDNKWLQEGHWCYQKWSPALGSLVVDEGRPPLPHAKLVEALQLLLPIIMQPYMIHRFHATRPLADTMTGVTAFQLDISNRTKGHPTVWETLEALTGLSAMQVIGLQLRRDTLKQSPAAALVQQVADILKYGAQEQAWRDVYHARKPIHVHALSSWRPLLCNWANLHQQHDACEFLEHLLGAGRPQVLQGKWESRIVSEVEGTETRGQHNTQRSITLDLADPYATTNLQALVDHWHTGGTYVQACTHPPRILLLRISRFLDTDAGETVKLHTRVTIPTAIQIPCYCDPHQGDYALMT
ncbi:unnamed protein product [Symbiodinium natans]|uniref:Reverse transcriptase domain-containing protein n=1 Tax=Symbiodinium natans TaxID=878477 RepID=A0A812LPY0_9DINO|nr:unnamed protein product [Symbiodinium natans]